MLLNVEFAQAAHKCPIVYPEEELWETKSKKLSPSQLLCEACWRTKETPENNKNILEVANWTSSLEIHTPKKIQFLL